MRNKDYTSYKATDFAKDNYFIGWQLNPDAHDNEFWQELMRTHPELVPEIERAIEILRSVRLNANDLSSAEREEETGKLHIRILRRKRQRVLARTLYVAAAACVILAVLMWQKTSDVKTHDERNSINNEICLVIDKQVTKLPQNAIVECNTEGNLSVNLRDGKQFASLKGGDEVNRLVVPKGKHSTLIMADGTKVWVNSGSEMRFPTLFAKDRREMQLTGEAYLEVAKDKKRPFTLIAPDFNIEVLGTKFNVSAYKEDHKHEVALLEGSVKVSVKGKEPVKLVPNQMAVIETERISTQEIDANLYACWRNGILSMSSEPLQDILRVLQRYYNVEIKTSAGVDNLKCNGKLLLSDSIDEVLQSIEATVPVKTERKGDKINIYLTKK